MSVQNKVAQANQDAAQRLLRIMGDRTRRTQEYFERKSYIGHVINDVGPVIRVLGHDYLRTSYRVAKGVQLANLTVGDEVLMTQTAHGMFVLTQVIRYEGDDSDDITVSGSITATTLNSDFVITDNLVVNGPIQGGAATLSSTLTVSAGGADVTGNSTIHGDLTVTGIISPDKVYTNDLKVATKVGFFGTTPVVAQAAWTTSNVVTTRTINANSITLDSLADVVGSIIQELQTFGLFR